MMIYFETIYYQCLKMTDNEFCETPNMYPNLSATLLNDPQEFRLKNPKEIKNYFIPEIK